eukprot:gene11623-8011_t
MNRLGLLGSERLPRHQRDVRWRCTTSNGLLSVPCRLCATRCSCSSSSASSPPAAPFYSPLGAGSPVQPLPIITILRRSSGAAIPTTALALCGGNGCGMSAMVLSCRALHGKPTQGHKVRTQHTMRWWRQSKARHLTAMPHEEALSRPHFPGYNEDVDAPMVVPSDACCFNCDGAIDADNINSYVWIPAGNARLPTRQGYFFHFHCFKCDRCKMRLMHNQFYSQDGRALCIACALGRDIRVPTRRWHTSFVNTHRTGSRLTGSFFPRHRSQMEFALNPNE